MSATETLTRLADLVGPGQFARLRYSVPETVEMGRLRHWQEQLLATVADELGIRIETANQLQDLFSNAEHVAVPIPRDQFLEKPYDYFHNEHVVIEDNWIRDAWHVHSFRDSVSYELARSASKTGGFVSVGAQKGPVMGASNSAICGGFRQSTLDRFWTRSLRAREAHGESSVDGEGQWDSEFTCRGLVAATDR